MSEQKIFELGKLLYESRIREAWGRQADVRLHQLPYPEHIGAERAAEHDLAITQAKALLKEYNVEKK